MKVVGFDPGIGRLGWAIIEKDKGLEKFAGAGCLETKANSELPSRLLKIYCFLNKLMEEHKPNQAAVEELFFSTNAKTAMSVAAARGVILLVCAQRKIPVFNYSPVKIKSAITGYGKADKKQIEYMICQTLKLKQAPKPDDAADAVAVALTHTNCAKF